MIVPCPFKIWCRSVTPSLRKQGDFRPLKNEPGIACWIVNNSAMYRRFCWNSLTWCKMDLRRLGIVKIHFRSNPRWLTAPKLFKSQ